PLPAISTRPPLIILPSLLHRSLPPPPPRSTLFPYTTLFRSKPHSPRSNSPRSASCPPAHRGPRWMKLDITPVASATFTEISKGRDRKSTRLHSSHVSISYAVFCLNKKNK